LNFKSIARTKKSQTELRIKSWLLASLIFDSIWPLKIKLFKDEKREIAKDPE